MINSKKNQKIYFFGDLYNLLFDKIEIYTNLISEMNKRDYDSRNEPFYISIDNKKMITIYVHSVDWFNDHYPLYNLNHDDIINIINDSDNICADSSTIGLICLNDLIDGDLENIIWRIKHYDLGLLFCTNDTASVKLHTEKEQIDTIDCPYCNGTGKQTTDNKSKKTKKIKCDECNGSGIQVGKYIALSHRIYVDGVNVLKVLS